MEVHIDRNKCEGNGLCAMSATEVFQLSADGTVVILNEHPSEDLRVQVEQAVDYCPQQAISIS